MARALGIELAETGLKLLLLEQNGKKPRIVQFHEAPIVPAEGQTWEAAAGAALREAFTASRIPRVSAVVALDSGDAILREISLPFKGDDQIARTARFEMESQIHNYTIEQLIVAHYKTGETDKGSLLLAAAVPKVVIEKRLKLLAEAGVDPMALDLDAAAVFNALLSAGAVDSQQPHLVLHGARKFTKLLFVEQGRPRSIRTIRFALPEKFEELDDAGQSGHANLLAREISRFLLASASGASPAHILLTGALDHEAARRLLAASTGLEVRSADVLAGLERAPGLEGALDSARIALPLGLALKGLDVDALRLDFRQEEFSYRRKYEPIKTTLLVLAELGVVLLAAVALHLHFTRDDLRKATSQVHEKYHRPIFEDVVRGQALGSGAEAYAKMEALHREVTGLGSQDLPIKTSARDAWRELAQALLNIQRKYEKQSMGGDNLRIDMSSLEIRQTTTEGNESFELYLRGKIRNVEWAGKLREELRRVEIFKDADVGDIKPDGEMYQFTLKAARSARKG